MNLTSFQLDCSCTAAVDTMDRFHSTLFLFLIYYLSRAPSFISIGLGVFLLFFSFLFNTFPSIELIKFLLWTVSFQFVLLSSRQKGYKNMINVNRRSADIFRLKLIEIVTTSQSAWNIVQLVNIIISFQKETKCYKLNVWQWLLHQLNHCPLAGRWKERRNQHTIHISLASFGTSLHLVSSRPLNTIDSNKLNNNGN